MQCVQLGMYPGPDRVTTVTCTVTGTKISLDTTHSYTGDHSYDATTTCTLEDDEVLWTDDVTVNLGRAAVMFGDNVEGDSPSGGGDSESYDLTDTEVYKLNTTLWAAETVAICHPDLSLGSMACGATGQHHYVVTRSAALALNPLCTPYYSTCPSHLKDVLFFYTLYEHKFCMHSAFSPPCASV